MELHNGRNGLTYYALICGAVMYIIGSLTVNSYLNVGC